MGLEAGRFYLLNRLLEVLFVVWVVIWEHLTALHTQGGVLIINYVLVITYQDR